MLLHHKQAKSQLVKKIYIAKLLATRQLSHVYTVDIPTKLALNAIIYAQQIALRKTVEMRQKRRASLETLVARDTSPR